MLIYKGFFIHFMLDFLLKIRYSIRINDNKKEKKHYVQFEKY